MAGRAVDTNFSSQFCEKYPENKTHCVDIYFLRYVNNSMQATENLRHNLLPIYS